MSKKWVDDFREDCYFEPSMELKYSKRYIRYCKYVRLISTIGGTVIFALAVIGMFMLANYVNEWEKDNNYPYGKLCELYNNCK